MSYLNFELILSSSIKYSLFYRHETFFARHWIFLPCVGSFCHTFRGQKWQKDPTPLYIHDCQSTGWYCLHHSGRQNRQGCVWEWSLFWCDVRVLIGCKYWTFPTLHSLGEVYEFHCTSQWFSTLLVVYSDGPLYFTMDQALVSLNSVRLLSGLTTWP